MEREVQALLRKSEHCSHAVELCRVKPSGQKRLRVVAVVSCIEKNNEACLFVLKRRLDKTLGVEVVIPILSDFRLALSQSTAVNLNDPASIAQSKTGFVLRMTTSKGNDICFEASAVELLHKLLVELKAAMTNAEKNAFSIDGDTHTWRKAYEWNSDHLSTQYRDAMEAGIDNASIARSFANSTVSNPFINFENAISANTLKQIKDAWAAKELRNREATFADYNSLKLFVGTWNVNGQSVSEPLDLWLMTDKEDVPDLYILGLQEMDLSTEAYLIADTTKEDEWCKAIEASIASVQTEKYIKVAAKKLVGMLLVVYIKRSIYTFLHDVSTSSVGTGILGMMGNKGAVGIRLKIFDSYISVVNSHLAADTSMVERRNQDYKDICKRLEFQLQSHYKDYIAYAQANPWVASSMDSAAALNGYPAGGIPSELFSDAFSSKSSLSLFDSDHVFWMGDLNYRVTISEKEAKTIIGEGNLSELLLFDQLNIERAAGRCFNGFSEGLVTFPPTYKYDIGTSRYDTSEKKRSPSWCDRILWFRNPLKLQDPSWLKMVSYTATQKLLMSDHKPVSAQFRAKVRKLNGEKLGEAQGDVARELDKFENEAMPDLDIDIYQLHFDIVKFMVPVTRTVTVENKGQVIAQYRFVAKLSEELICKSWCYISPSTGALLPGEKMTINVTIMVERASSESLNMGIDQLEEILILHTENGRDRFMTISGVWLPSIFGCSLDLLCRLIRPIRSYSQDELLSIHRAINQANDKDEQEPSSSTSDGPDPLPPSPTSENKLSMPKELWRLIDFIYKFGMDIDNLFLSPGDPNLTEYFRDCLDTGTEFNLSVLLGDPFALEAEFGSSESLKEGQDVADKKLPTTLEETPLNIDDLINTMTKSKVDSTLRLPRALGQAVSVHSAAETLLKLLESLSIAIIPESLHRRCVLEGYNTFASARQIIQLLPSNHFNSFMYIVGFLREVLANYRGRGGLDREKLAQVFAPVLLYSQGNRSVNLTSPTSPTYPMVGPSKTAKEAPTVKISPVEATSPTTSNSQSSPTKITAAYLTGMLFGGATQVVSSVMPVSPKVTTSIIGPPLSSESSTGIDAWNRKRWMFLQHFLEPSNII